MSHAELHTYKVSGTLFRVAQNYTPVKVMGKGSYGIVIAAVDKTDSSQKVAIKRIKPMAADEWDARHTLREIRIMRLLGDHPNIIGLLNVRALEEHNELYITMEFMDTDLHQIIRSKQTLTEQHFKYLMLQLINGLRAMHHFNILHRDLKPGNLLVNKECQLRITDFGLSRYAPMENQIPDEAVAKEKLTEYVVTRWYRCPELLLSPAQNYSCAVDMWSAGCILAELLLRKPFMPGKNYVHQVQLILDTFGTPEAEEGFGFALSEDARQYLAAQPRRPARDLAELMPPGTSEAGLDLLRGLMAYGPNARLSAEAAAQHPFFADAPAVAGWQPPYHSADQVDLGFDSQQLSLDRLKELIVQEDRIYNGLVGAASGAATRAEDFMDVSAGNGGGGGGGADGGAEGEAGQPVAAGGGDGAQPAANGGGGGGGGGAVLRQPSREHEVTADEHTTHRLDQKRSQHSMSMQAMMAQQQMTESRRSHQVKETVQEEEGAAVPVGSGAELDAALAAGVAPAAASGLADSMQRFSIQAEARQNDHNSKTSEAGGSGDEAERRSQSLKDILKPYTKQPNPNELPAIKQKNKQPLETSSSAPHTLR